MSLVAQPAVMAADKRQNLVVITLPKSNTTIEIVKTLTSIFADGETIERLTCHRISNISPFGSR